MLGTASDRLRYLSPSVHSLIKTLCSQYNELAFLKECDKSLREGSSFTTAFGQAVENAEYDESIKQAIRPLAHELGSSDLEGQLAAIAYAISCLEQISIQQNEKCKTNGRLYKALGVLGGIAMAILLY